MIILGIMVTHETIEFLAFLFFKIGILVYAAYDIHESINTFVERFIHHIH